MVSRLDRAIFPGRPSELEVLCLENDVSLRLMSDLRYPRSQAENRSVVMRCYRSAKIRSTRVRVADTSMP